MGANQFTSYFHTTLRARMTAGQLIDDYDELKQWGNVAKKYNVSPAYIIMLRKQLGIFKPTFTSGSNYGGIYCKHTKNEGKRIDNRGYVLVGRHHKENDHNEVVYEHKLVMEKHLGRKLKPGEVIHHIDNNKSNNDITNLFLCNHSTHRKCDLSAQDVCYELYKKGIVIFDKQEGIYKVKK